jgi:DNA-binding response OmpR family regulator
LLSFLAGNDEDSFSYCISTLAGGDGKTKQMSTKLIKAILLVEDNPGDARLICEMFGEQGSHNTELTHVECMSAAEKYLSERAVDIILLDPGLPDAQGLGAIRRAHGAAPRVPLVVLTGRASLTRRRARLSH